MHWVIQDTMFDESGWTELLLVLDRFSIPYTLVKTVPFTSEIIPDVNPEGPTVVMGATTMTRLAKAKGWTPGSFTNLNFDYTVQVKHWGDRFFNFDSVIYKLSEVPPQTGDFFVRPVHDSKSFTGQIFNWDEFNTWIERVLGQYTEAAYASVTPNTLVQVSEAKPIHAEYRLWVVDSKIVTSCLYKRGFRVHHSTQVDQEILDYAQECINIWEPAKAYCLDIFVGEDGPKIGEVNCINSAGFYAANIQKLVLALEDLGEHYAKTL